MTQPVRQNHQTVQLRDFCISQVETPPQHNVITAIKSLFLNPEKCQQAQMNPGMSPPGGRADAVMGGQAWSSVRHVPLTEPLLIARMLAAEVLLAWACIFLSHSSCRLRLLMHRSYPLSCSPGHREGMVKKTLGASADQVLSWSVSRAVLNAGSLDPGRGNRGHRKAQLPESSPY